MLGEYQMKTPSRVYAGIGVLDEVTRILEQERPAKVALLTDKGIVETGLHSIVLDRILAAGISVVLIDDIPSEPEYHAVEDVVAKFNACNADFIIALGGGSVMDVTENKTGTLRAQTHGHEPLVFDAHDQDTRYRGPVQCSPTLSASLLNHPLVVEPSQEPALFENHGIDARYTGPHSVSPTLSARAGTGGNNLPLITAPDETYCITGNAIDRQPHNGGNGIGYQADLAYTLTATDHHAVFRRQRVDRFQSDTIVGTQSARQYKDATDLICQQITEKENMILLIRRLTPLECERLQGYPDGGTDLPNASDSNRYKALGNSVAIPCVQYLIQRIAMCLVLGFQGYF